MTGRMTPEEHRADEEYHKRVSELIECFAQYPTEHGGVRFGECKSDHNCNSCPAYYEFYKTAHCYEQDDKVQNFSEALWLTSQFYGIADAYMCDGEIEAWSKEYTPEKYKAALKRQAELMGDPEPEPERPKKADKMSETGQMSIFDFI